MSTIHIATCQITASTEELKKKKSQRTAAMFEVWWEKSTLYIFNGLCLSEALWVIYVKDRLKLGGFKLLCENLPSKAENSITP